MVATTVNMEQIRRNLIFEKELLPHSEALLTFAYHLTYNMTQAEDLLQDTYEKAFRNIDNYEEGTNAKAWLFKILRNTFINDYRRRIRWRNQGSEIDIANLQAREDNGAYDPALVQRETQDEGMGDTVTIAVNNLPVPFRTVVLLCDIEDFSYEEISAILNIKIGTVRSRLHRARNLLKDQLKDYAESMGYTDRRS